MASEWYLITKPTYNSGFEGEEFNAYKNDGLEEILGVDSPISSSVSIINADLSVISTFRAVVQNNTSDSEDNSSERQIITTIGTLKCGDYILYNGNVYLIISFVGNNGIYEKAIIQLTNYTLRFQSPTGIILSYPCITNNRVQGTGDTDSKVMTLPAGRKIILLPHDENTTLLRNDRRLFVDLHPTDPRPYEIDFVDSTKFNYGDKGLLEIYVSETVLQVNDGDLPKDRPDLGICNYREPTIEPETPVEGEIYATISVDGDLILGNRNYVTLSPTFYNADDTVNETISAIWDYIYPLNNQSAFTIIQDGNDVKIKVADEMYELIGKKLVVNVSDGNGGFVGMVELEIGSGW